VSLIESRRTVVAGIGVTLIVTPPFTFQVTTDFTTGIPAAFSPNSGAWSLAGGQYQAVTGGTAISLYCLNASLVNDATTSASVGSGVGYIPALAISGSNATL